MSKSTSSFNRQFVSSNPQASSTPAGHKLSHSRPLPCFDQCTKSEKFEFKKANFRFDFNTKPCSPVKSAPPVSRVFAFRKWAPEKAHAVSFRAGEDPQADLAFQSNFYDSDRSELYFEQCFTIEKRLGEGSFGEVMQVKSRDNSMRYAVKRSREKFRNESDRKRKLDEVKKHEQLPSHPNCVKFIKAWEEKHRLYIQTELCATSLQRYLSKHSHVPIYKIYKYLVDLLKGLHHIHSHGFIHFDVKPANIFLSLDGTCKIGDFGLVVEQSKEDILNATEGDNRYMALELLNGVFTNKADVFSLGIALLEITCNLELPVGGVSWQLLRQGYIPQECVNQLPFDLRTIIQWLMTPNYEERPSIVEVLNHPIVRQLANQHLPHFVTYHCLNSMFHFFCSLLFFTALLFFRPLKLLQKASNNQTSAKAKKESVANQWNSSISSEHYWLDNNGADAGRSSELNEDVFCMTPNLPKHSRLTPTPRNSSPVAHRYHGSGRVEYSPDLSPLSHSRYTPTHKLLVKDMRSDPDFDYYPLNLDKQEVSEDSLEELYSSKPRNLIDALNEVSMSSDASGTDSDL
uniref:membrane-associated tyrosine- and threonine-specific cdc2-inhibitory kinase n=1 Tax=Ciona intestinalis TaxID=7719 RepID=UPI000180C26A|nr:membrane-associated tyrosine- and threonine-specific cdc2-inhibitory kinase [Ciona intestinalis]|eukprot:XP_002131417.1 membrane-associated tyrosine- and threonine-specific cdc2-inhibitory kinase [Ciona intestinalis]